MTARMEATRHIRYDMSRTMLINFADQLMAAVMGPVGAITC